VKTFKFKLVDLNIKRWRIVLSDDILLKDPLVLSFVGENVVIGRRSILIADGVISGLGEYSLLRKYSRDVHVIDCRDKLAIPGFINAHTHIPMTVFRGVADNYTTLTWLKIIWPLEKLLTKEDIYYGALLGLIESVKSGTTCIADHYFNEEVVIEVSKKIGVRIVGSESILDIDGWRDGEKSVSETLRLYRRYKDDPLVKIAFAPHSVYSVKRETFELIRKFSKEYNIDIHIHASESVEEVNRSLELYGKTPIEYLDSLGLMSERLLIAHANVVNDNELRLIKSKGANIVHVPTTAMKHGLDICPVSKMLRYGVTVSLGTDGAGSNNNLDMIEEMRIAVLAQRFLFKNPRAISAKDALFMATINGGKALNLKNVGNIAPGFKADIVLLNLKRERMVPLHNVPSHVVFSVNQSDIDLVIVNGKIIVENGRILTVDEEFILERVQRVFEKLVNKGGLIPSLSSEPRKSIVELGCKSINLLRK